MARRKISIPTAIVVEHPWFDERCNRIRNLCSSRERRGSKSRSSDQSLCHVLHDRVLSVLSILETALTAIAFLGSERDDGTFSRSDFRSRPETGEHQLFGFLTTEANAEVDDPHQRGSTIITSHWHEVIADPTIAHAVLDRLVHNAHRLELRGDSMRKITAHNASLDVEKKS